MASAVPEIKAQAAVEMAQDPNSSVTAEAAQKKIVDESKKAGVQAFTFDPDASPEEKAAQARAVSDRIAGPKIPTDILFSAACAGRFPPPAPFNQRRCCDGYGAGRAREIRSPFARHCEGLGGSSAARNERGEATDKWSASGYR
jgi:hypothetical protein